MISARERRRRMDFYDRLEQEARIETHVLGADGKRIPNELHSKLAANRMKFWYPREAYQDVPPSPHGTEET